ncbi:helix-turn-helix domain-containing protein [Microbacterium sp. EYE_5]|uniref:GlxA family transcriptional regulator n=1 Tax=unclassified Microbacterium TaxID=2609290 RepID=UPI0020048CAA|nr:MULTISPECIES: helix-turn-helix domain-containing protein [unclassified Microbacterium]MCK6079348.1 helix-turn-helix domain-containing protein [Microbacterium sp. EYE_382]MCK6084618.1 helix-turn-helix domain-containing protein [Microbacterium sp. EYE_384]MCK6123153.1 helix-turn-helix domain-containing protein [Microbacterium sp. EYE_80]MCK6125382.1 helix-turn-helix domain-containing protein [Microbacterium sp. EYE_79]MCK6140302.1 helix-turn-helix domain-containing protein [Microbacterium sp.
MLSTVACVVQPGFAPFEFGLACEAFGLDRSDDGIPNFDFRIVTPDPGAVASNIGFSINVDADLSFADEADLVVVTPIPREAWGSVDERMLEVIRRAVDRGAWVLTVCSGAFAVAASGVLSGRRATTHWRYAETMTRMYPDIEVDPNVLYVQDGRIITSAGTAAGLDACLHLLRLELGAEAANTIARRMVVPPQRDGGQAQFIAAPLPVSTSLSLTPVTEWMLENLRLDLSVDQLAAHAHMSPRTFARRFKADYGTTPAAWLGRQRILHAQRLLEQTDLGLDAIAYECGFGSAAVLRQNFARVLGLTPTAYRSRFACATDLAS